jgi:hypothetical protein
LNSSVLRQNLVTIDIVDFLQPSATLYQYEGITILAVLLFQNLTQQSITSGEQFDEVIENTGRTEFWRSTGAERDFASQSQIRDVHKKYNGWCKRCDREQKGRRIVMVRRFSSFAYRQQERWGLFSFLRGAPNQRAYLQVQQGGKR